MKKVKMLFKWGVKYWYMTLFVLFTTILLQYMYSEIPLFIQYGIKVLEGVTPDVGLQKIFLEVLKKYDDYVVLRFSSNSSGSVLSATSRLIL